MRFSVLSPRWDSYNVEGLGENARSCVLKIDSAYGGMLLPADIEQVPRMIVIGVGYHNRFGHPKPDVMERYATRKIRVLRTDLDGEIALRFEAQGVAAEGYRSHYRRYWQSPLLISQ